MYDNAIKPRKGQAEEQTGDEDRDRVVQGLTAIEQENRWEMYAWV